jgi:DNA-binding CsgD family transcriptional regulator/tetratricopeptide (TPR) repeat protein
VRQRKSEVDKPVRVDAPQRDDSFLERDEIVSTLTGLLGGVRSSAEGSLVLVCGEAGVGKTLLLRTFCAMQVRPVRVLWGGCEPLRTPRPLGPIYDIAEMTGGRFQASIAGEPRPYEVAIALLNELRARNPTVVVLEDLHWADEATLDVLTLLAAKVDSARALVLASYRDDELDRSQQLRVLLGELVRGHKRVKVQPLSQAAVAQLAAPHGLDAEELYRLTSGNPFFVTEILATGSDEIPDTIRNAVLARAARLSGVARRLLEAVAVVPGHVELSLLAALADELIDRLDECLASGMLVQGPARVAFRHELARLAVEEAIGPNRRVALHRAALAAIEARGGDNPELAGLAHHADAAGDREAVLRWTPWAAERASSSGAHREAAGQYARALRFADGLSADRRADLLARRVDECWLTDQFDAAIEAQEELLSCRRQLGDRLGEGGALWMLSRLQFFVGRVRDGEALAMAAIELLEQLPPGHELAMAYGNVSQRRMVEEDLEGARTWATRALELARRLDDIEAIVYALTNLGAAELQRGSDDGRVRLEEALALAQRHGLEDYAGRVFPSTIISALGTRRFDLADVHLALGLEYCRERGLDTWRLYLFACRARLELQRGRWDEAADSAALVLRDPRSATFARGLALTTLGLVRVRRGDPEQSTPLSEEQAIAQPTQELARIGPVAAARAEAAWLVGDYATVEQETDAALSLALKRQSSWLVGELSYWRWLAGVHDDVPRRAAAGPYALSIAGKWTAAAEQWREIGCPYEAALALADADDEAALRQAHDELVALGARPAAAIVARRLRERGVRGVPRGPRPETRENPAGLTPRELEVLALLAEGLRNAQIAQHLVVSVKTVDHHVSGVLRKLNVRSRGEASAKARRLGLLSEAEHSHTVSG